MYIFAACVCIHMTELMRPLEHFFQIEFFATPYTTSKLALILTLYYLEKRGNLAFLKIPGIKDYLRILPLLLRGCLETP